MKTIGEKIKALREAAVPPMSQQELARTAGVSQTTVADLERGRNETSRKLTSIANALGVTAEQLETQTLTELRQIQSGESSGSTLSLLARKTLSQPEHNRRASKAALDLMRELDRGDLAPEVQAQLTADLEAKLKFVRSILRKHKNKGD